MYNLTANISDGSSIGYIHFLNYVTDGFFAYLFVIAIFMILFLALLSKGYIFKRCFAGAIFPTTIITFILKMMDAGISDQFVVGMILALAIAGVSLSWGD